MDFFKKGQALKTELKNLVYEFMKTHDSCSFLSDGMRQSDIFRECGMDWGAKENCSSSQQQYYVVAILRDLEEEKKVQRDLITKKWKLCK